MSPPLGQATRALAGGIGSSIGSIVLLAAWLGAALFFSAAMAPALFRLLPTPALAGAVVGRTLPVVLVSGVPVGIVVALVAWRSTPATGPRLVTAICALGVAVMCAIAQFWIGGRIAHLRRSLGATLESLPPGDPARAAFGRLHALSVASLGLAVLLAVIALAALAHHVFDLLRALDLRERLRRGRRRGRGVRVRRGARVLPRVRVHVGRAARERRRKQKRAREEHESREFHPVLLSVDCGMRISDCGF